MAKLAHKDGAKLFEDWRGNDDIGQNGKQAAIRRSTPEERRHENVGVQDHPHLRCLVEKVVNQPLALFLGQAGKLNASLPACRLDPVAITINEPVKRVISADELGQRGASRSR